VRVLDCLVAPPETRNCNSERTGKSANKGALLWAPCVQPPSDTVLLILFTLFHIAGNTATRTTTCLVTHDDQDDQLASVLEAIVTVLACTEPTLVILILRPLPGIELARLACVHRVFWVGLQALRHEHPSGWRYMPPTALEVKWLKGLGRMVAASAFGDMSVLAAMVAAGRDEHGKPLAEARVLRRRTLLDWSLSVAAEHGQYEAVELLMTAGAKDLRAALMAACLKGHAAIVKRLTSRISADNEAELTAAAVRGHSALEALLCQRDKEMCFGTSSFMKHELRLFKCAIVAQHVQIVDTLIAYSAKLRARHEETRLHMWRIHDSAYRNCKVF
jgi:hypothetical protein